MKRSLGSFVTAVVIAIVGSGTWWFFHESRATSQDESATADKAESSQGPIAPVKVVPVKKGTLAEEITVYGMIVPAAGAAQTITIPFESRVRRMLVTEGQQVTRGDPLVEIEPSPETNLQVQQARSEFESAKKELDYMQQHFALHFSTTVQLLQAKQALEQVQVKLESMRRRGSESPQILHADVTSLISKLAVQEGAIVAAANLLIELVAQTRLEARLGVEPEDSDKVNPRQEVSLARVNAPGTKSIVGRIRKISRAADATTRLVQVFTELPSTSKFLLGEYVLGKVPIASADGLIVPRSAVLPEEDHYVLFTVKDGRAREHRVRVE